MVLRQPFDYSPKHQNRTLHIYLPNDYEHSQERYPVMYFFDGHNLFRDSDATYGKCWGLETFLDHWSKRMIVVGMECGHQGRERLDEYCPWDVHGGSLGEIHGMGRETMRWLTTEVKPWVDAHYRTYPFREATGIAGSSMGGLMSIYGVAAYNDVFSKAACLSSVIRLCRRQLLGSIQNIHPDTRVYLSWGTEETKKVGKFSPTAIANREIAEAFWKQGAMATIFCQEGGRHCEADWEKQIPGFMEYLWF